MLVNGQGNGQCWPGAGDVGQNGWAMDSSAAAVVVGAMLAAAAASCCNDAAAVADLTVW